MEQTLKNACINKTTYCYWSYIAQKLQLQYITNLLSCCLLATNRGSSGYRPKHYFLYNINHPNKYGVPQVDLSSDEMTTAIEENSFTYSQLLIEMVIFKTFAHHRCDVVITDCLKIIIY